MFDGTPLELCGREQAPGRVRLRARGAGGELLMKATAETDA